MADLVAITLIRHGETLANRQRKYQGWIDEPLLAEEKVRLSNLGHLYQTPDLLIASDLKRCMETAIRLFPGKEIVSDQRLRELNFGDFEGKSYDELKDVKEYREWLSGQLKKQPPNGEHFDDFIKRLQEGWQEITNRFRDQAITEIAVVTHGGVIRYFLETYSAERKSFWEWDVELGCSYRLIAERDQLRRGERCISLQEVPIMEKPSG